MPVENHWFVIMLLSFITSTCFSPLLSSIPWNSHQNPTLMFLPHLKKCWISTASRRKSKNFTIWLHCSSPHHHLCYRVQVHKISWAELASEEDQAEFNLCRRAYFILRKHSRYFSLQAIVFKMNLAHHFEKMWFLPKVEFGNETLGFTLFQNLTTEWSFIKFY